MMDNEMYIDYLTKINYLSRTKDSTIKDFVDKEIEKIYRKCILDNQKLIKGDMMDDLSSIFKKLNNTQIDNLMMMNYYFDHIYVLNLDRRPDRMKHMSKYLTKFNIFNWSRFTAIDGKESPHYDEWLNYKKQSMTSTERMKYQRRAIASPGSWAILKSMYLMLKDAINKGYKTILVLQDDLLFHKKFVEEFMKIPSYVPKNWKLLYLGATQHNWTHVQFPKHTDKYYFPMGTADGAFSVAIHHSIFKELINEIIKFNIPFDSGPLKTIQKRYGKQCITLYPNLMIADIRDSDLRDSRQLDLFGKKFGWDLKLYDIPSRSFI